MRPFLARAGGRLLARTVAVVDERYNQHWQERLGHLSLFEALPETREATQLLIDAACDWLKAQGMEAARAGFGLLDFPFAIDDYTSLPPSRARQNPAYYHQLLKDAGFESEKGCVDYKIAVRPELLARWEHALEGARRAGDEIIPLKDVPASRRVSEFTDTWNDAFKAHWGLTPSSRSCLRRWHQRACWRPPSLPTGLVLPSGCCTSCRRAPRGPSSSLAVWCSRDSAPLTCH